MKKHSKIISAVLSAAVVAGMAASIACAEEPGIAAGDSIRLYTGQIYEYEWCDDANCNYAETSCPQVTLDKETADQYPKLMDALQELNDQKKTEFHENYQEILEDAKERFQENPEYFGTFTDAETWYVVRADRHIVSLLGVRSGYLGGAHGYSGYAGMNYDPESGKLLKLSELVAEEGAFKEKVKEEVLSRYPDVEKDLTEAYFQEKSLDDMIWTAGCEGITCYFDAYTLGPYAMGTQNVLIPYEGNDAMIGGAAADAPKNFGVEFPVGESLKVGGRELAVSGEADEYGGYESISIWLDGKETVLNDCESVYSITPFYLRKDGGEYLYLEYSSDNDYRLFDICRLQEKPERIDTSFLATAGMFVEDASYTATAAMSDPENLLLSTRIQLLGTMSGRRSYHVGDDGMPQANEPYFHIVGERILTTKKELSCAEVDGEGNETGSMTIPAKTALTALRTDNESLFDLSLQDGRIARVEVSGESFPHTIGGEDIEEIFDGIQFAG